MTNVQNFGFPSIVSFQYLHTQRMAARDVGSDLTHVDNG